MSHGPEDEDDATRVRSSRAPAAGAPPADAPELTLTRLSSDANSGATLTRTAPAADLTLTRSAPQEALTLARAPFTAPTSDPGPTQFGPGYRLRARYQLIEPIGQGAMGQVWKARDTYIDRGRNPFVAIKVFRTDFQNHPLAFQAMQVEASRAMKLRI